MKEAPAVDNLNKKLREKNVRLNKLFTQSLIETKEAFHRALKRYWVIDRKPPKFLLGNIAPELPGTNLTSCQVFANRNHLIKLIEKNGQVVIYGAHYQSLSEKIISITQPKSLFILDNAFKNSLTASIQPALDSGQAIVYEADKFNLNSFQEGQLDCVFLEHNYKYKAVKKDMKLASKMIKPGGLIVCSNYITWSPLEALPYGVCCAVNEFIIERNWQMVGLVLHPMGYHDVVIRKPK